ncbi:flagellin [Primorskyibacter sp. S87]|uniref:flagellin n=1 Tax=Primorskyibacter sp. S87 TaxID=3415126 RepID=UPI003C7DB691
MSLISIGDLAHSLLLRNRGTSIKNSINTLTEELSTGKTSAPAKRLGGDYAHIADIDRKLARLSGFNVATAEAKLFGEVAQSALSNIEQNASNLGSTLSTISSYDQDIVRNQSSDQAQTELLAIAATINITAGGRSIFAGTRSDGPAIKSGEVLLTELQSVVAGLTTASDVISAVDNWFANPTGFDSVIYSGSSQSLAPVRISGSDFAEFSLRADGPVLKSVLRDTALAALATDPAHNLNSAEQSKLLVTAGNRLTNDSTSIIEVRAEIGFIQQKIESAGAQNSATATSLQIARNTLLAVDPHVTAVRLQEAQLQLESLYAVTVRTSQLSLVRFLK